MSRLTAEERDKEMADFLFYHIYQACPDGKKPVNALELGRVFFMIPESIWRFMKILEQEDKIELLGNWQVRLTADGRTCYVEWEGWP